MSKADTNLNIPFLPKRLNDVPIVFRGMTMREVVLVCAIGFGVWLVPGIVLGIVFGAIALAPTLAFLGMGLFLFFGGTIMRRLRRGHPANAMYRDINFWLAKKGISMGGEHIIHRSTVYRTARDRRNLQ
ncbi:TIGR03750 family conjugal transfer protein [Carnimonas bestiolae]|uniref:TIGR03750 family conjugal transfer protein n=1 Tax=Carnimonas bestiolae TaxID=3402172 RepID=UPI003EDBAD5F